MSKLPADTLYRICDNVNCHHCRPKQEMLQVGPWHFCSEACVGKERFYAKILKEEETK